MHKRNNKLVDGWSLVHVGSGLLLAWVMPPLTALIITIAWEPLEVLIISPLVARFGIIFGYETWRNSLADIGCDVIGVLLGALVLTPLLAPPFHFLHLL